jgi:hypothetical protein
VELKVNDTIQKWAQKRWHCDETVKSSDFWKKDTGVDIIQTLDGVPFGIVIKRIIRDTPPMTINKWIEQIQEVNKGSFIFEGITLVIVAEDELLARTVRTFKPIDVPYIDIVYGYIKSGGDFSPIN